MKEEKERKNAIFTCIDPNFRFGVFNIYYN